MVKAVSDPGRRRQLLSGVTALVLAGLPLGARAQGAGACRASACSSARQSASTSAFLQGMRELGYVDGKSIVIERRSDEGTTRSFPRSRRSSFSSSRGDRIDRHAGIDRGQGGDRHDPDRDRGRGRPGRRRYRRQPRAAGQQRHGNGRAYARRGRQAGRAHAPDAAAHSLRWPCSGIPPTSSSSSRRWARRSSPARECASSPSPSACGRARIWRARSSLWDPNARMRCSSFRIR